MLISNFQLHFIFIKILDNNKKIIISHVELRDHRSRETLILYKQQTDSNWFAIFKVSLISQEVSRIKNHQQRTRDHC